MNDDEDEDDDGDDDSEYEEIDVLIKCMMKKGMLKKKLIAFVVVKENVATDVASANDGLCMFFGMF